MRILIGQPKLEQEITQLEADLMNNPNINMLIYPEGYLNGNVEKACQLAQNYATTIVTGYKMPKDRAIIINQDGEIVLDRKKYEDSPVVQVNGLQVGFILCDEIVLQGLDKIKGNRCDLLIHPIGVGMFSEEQFEEWILLAKQLAKQSHSFMIGTSHADGSFNGSHTSIPIAYGINKNGEEVFIRKNDTRSIIFDTNTNALELANVGKGDKSL